MRIILILGVFLIAEKNFAQGFELEVFVRPALTSLRGNDIVKDNLDPAINLSTGISANCFLNKNSIMSLTILYDKKGGRGESHTTLRGFQNEIIAEGTLTHQSNFEYVTIPLQWRARRGQKLKYEFGIGVYTGFLLRQETASKGLGSSSTEDDTGMFRKFDFGLSTSFNLLIPLNDSVAVKVGVNDNLGLMNVSDVPVADKGTIEHNSLGLLVGIGFQLN